MTQRYFEEVNVGEELPPVERLPTEELAAAFFSREGQPPQEPERIPVARAGFSGIIVPGLLKVSWLGQFVAEWAGPEAMLKSVRVAYRRPDPTGEPLLLTGTVVDKQEEDGKPYVDVEVATIAREGPSVRGTVRVELPRKP